jgi:hypothetical protein
MSARLYQANPEIVYRPEGLDGALLFDPDTGRVEVVNLTGAFVWEQLDGTRDLAAVCQALRQAFDELPEDAALLADVEGFIGLLLRLGFAAEVDTPGQAR